MLDPAEVEIDHILRFEGQSDPGDMTILFALRTPSGAKGVYSAPFGADDAGRGRRRHRPLQHRTADGTLDDCIRPEDGSAP